MPELLLLRLAMLLLLLLLLLPLLVLLLLALLPPRLVLLLLALLPPLLVLLAEGDVAGRGHLHGALVGIGRLHSPRGHLRRHLSWGVGARRYRQSVALAIHS
jgi:hypothetical protein